jgi:hypothetical protein
MRVAVPRGPARRPRSTDSILLGAGAGHTGPNLRTGHSAACGGRLANLDATPLTGVPVRPIVATRVGLLAAQLGSRLLAFLI